MLTSMIFNSACSGLIPDSYSYLIVESRMGMLSESKLAAWWNCILLVEPPGKWNRI